MAKSKNTFVTVKNKVATKQFKSLGASCPSTVQERSSVYCKAIAYYTDGSQTDVTSKVSWSDNSGYVRLYSNGRLYASSVSRDRSATVNARYSEGGVAKSKNTFVVIKNR